MSLQPTNKWIVISPLEDAGKTGGLYMPGNINGAYRLAKLVALAECDETKHMTAGDTIVYDTLGTVEVRIGDLRMTVVKAVNVVGIVRE